MRRYRIVEDENSTGSLNSPMEPRESEFPFTQAAAPISFQSKSQRNAVILFSLTTVLLFADQNLMAPNLTAIAEDFGFDEDEKDRKLGGDISLAFFLLGAPASLLIGILADTAERPFVFACTVLIGEGACFASYFTKTYEMLYVCRAITGFAVGGAFPVIYSVLGDMFAADSRHKVSAIVSFGVGAGIAVGQAIAGYIGPTFGWRVPFLLVSFPAIGCALAVLFFVDDPERGAMEQAVLEKSEDDGILLVPISSQTDISSKQENKSTPPKQGRDSDGIMLNRDSTIQGEDSPLAVRNFFKLISTPTMLLALIQGAPGKKQ